MFAVIHALATANLDPQLRNTFAYRFAVAEVASRYPPQSNLNLCPCTHVSQATQPVRDWRTVIFRLVSAQFDHREWQFYSYFELVESVKLQQRV